MLDRWIIFDVQLGKVLFAAVLIALLHVDKCLSINDEGLALLQFHMRVASDPYGALSNWNCSDENPCQWTGVHCVDGVVHMLDLRNLSLEGTLAPELGKLSGLRSLLLCKNNFSGVIPKEITELTMLEVLDLRGNKLNGVVPAEMGDMGSLKHLLICDNKFQGGIPTEFRKQKMLTDLQYDQNLLSHGAIGFEYIDRKLGNGIWQRILKQLNMADSLIVSFKGKLQHFPNILPLFKIKRDPSHGHQKSCYEDQAGLTEPYIEQKLLHVSNPARRQMREGSSQNLDATPVSSTPPEQITVTLPSIGSGSFPAVSRSDGGNKPPQPTSSHEAIHPSAISTPQPIYSQPSSSNESGMLKYLYIVPAGVFVLSLVAFIILMFRKKGGSTIGPWKTGLSGQLQKAFVTGVPKLNRAELETACEDFSNIISSFSDYTTFKGTLSSGVEIAVASTTIKSVKDWSKRSEMHFRKKVDILSRVNHKNFVNLLGYCEEQEPFLRMMVFEYAPSGSLHDHLHVKEFEHLDWAARMRIIMGVVYCLQYMHHELNPPIPHPNLTSHAVYLTEDYAAKLADAGFWTELITKGKVSDDDVESNSCELSITDSESNVYNFGILLLEIISGKLPHSEEQGSLVNWAAQYLNDRRTISYMVDPSLQSIKNNELDILCEVIMGCTNPDPRQRPTMKEITTKLKGVLTISPEAATPRLSPLWWAELEILSLEAS